jgi:glycosyltransferase involved in cell wall biosynthesis
VINANLLPVKNHMMLLKALVIVHRKKIEFKLIIIGKEIDEHYTNTLKVFIQENGLGNNVMLMGQVTDIEKFLGLASIGVITSNSEGLPMSLLEYGLAKLAVISTNVGQCASVLKDGEFGWIVEPNDVESLAKVIELLLMNPSLVEDKSSKFYEHIKTEFSGECFFEEYNSYLNTL